MPQRPTGTSEGDEPALVESGSITPEATADAEATVTSAGGVGLGADLGKPIGRRRGEASGAANIAQHAKAVLEGITGLDADHVSAVAQKLDGWHVTIDLVELRRIPASTDVLAAYEAVLGPTGELLSYRRTRRYFRDQMLEES